MSRQSVIGARLAALGIALAVTGCADIWGFEDPIPRRDGGIDGPLDSAAPDACSCVPVAPDGWQGPFELAEVIGAADAGDLPTCGAAYPTAAFSLHGSPAAAPTSCACTCDVTCGAPVASVFSDTNCSRSCGTAIVGAGCTALSLPSCPQNGGGGPGKGIGLSTRFAAPVGSCSAQPSAATEPPPWTANAALCAPSAPAAGACDAGAVCAPPTDPGFEARTACVVREGTVSCPTGYPVSHGRQGPQGPYFASADDTRACGCTCDPPSGAGCALDVTTYDDVSCPTARDHVTTATACVSAVAAVAVTGPGMCTAHGILTGAFTPTGPATVCCTQ